jgi:hypothetical protein
MTLHKKLRAASSVCIERAGQERRGISVEIHLGSEALQHE